jgi:hypothetical protein
MQSPGSAGLSPAGFFVRNATLFRGFPLFNDFCALIRATKGTMNVESQKIRISSQ